MCRDPHWITSFDRLVACSETLSSECCILWCVVLDYTFTAPYSVLLHLVVGGSEAMHKYSVQHTKCASKAAVSPEGREAAVGWEAERGG